MLENVFLIWIMSIIAFIPIALWGYFFGYIESDNFNKKRFFIGILAGWLAVFPVLFLWDIIDEFSFHLFNIFSYIHSFGQETWIIQVFFSFLSLLFFFSLLPFLLFYLTPYSKEKLKIFFSRFLLFSFYFFLISLWLYGINFIFSVFDGLQFDTEISIAFWDIVFNSLKLIIFYYLLIGILEELSKFLFFSYERNFSVVSAKQGVISSIFIALGFAFVENILYFISLYENFWVGKELISTYFLRNIFSVFLHILCSSIFAYYFSTLYLKFKNNYTFEFIKVLFIWFFLALFFHAIFDIFLTFNLMFFVFLYIIWGYFYLTYIFYKQ